MKNDFRVLGISGSSLFVNGRRRGTVSLLLDMRAIPINSILLLCSPILSFSGQVLLISDVHIDNQYDGSLSSSCKCEARYDTGTCSDNSLRNPFGQFGCDASPKLMQSALSAAAAVAPDPNFVIFGGDYMSHSSPSATATLSAISAVTDLLAQHWGDKSGDFDTIYPTTGNSDFYGDYHLNITDDAENTWLAKVSAIWGSTRSTISASGFFAVEAIPGITVISINTIIYSPHHTPHISSSIDSDPFGQFAWLEETLATLEASASSESPKRVWIVGHIPPAVDAFSYSELWQSAYAEKYHDIVTTYPSLIAVQFFGHVHSDEFRCLTSRDKASSTGTSSYLWWGEELDEKGPAPMIITGAVSPVYNANPSFRVIEFENDTSSASFGAITNWHVFTTLLSEGDGKLDSSIDLSWFKLYSAAEQYNLTSFDNNAFKSFAANLLTDDSLFSAFITNIHADCTASLELEAYGLKSEALDKCYTPLECISDSNAIYSSSSSSSSDISSSCRKKHVCALLHGARSDAFSACVSCTTGRDDTLTLEAMAILDASGCDMTIFSSSSSSIAALCRSPLCGIWHYADSHMHLRTFILVTTFLLAGIVIIFAYRRQFFHRLGHRHENYHWREKESKLYALPSLYTEDRPRKSWYTSRLSESSREAQSRENETADSSFSLLSTQNIEEQERILPLGNEGTSLLAQYK